MINARHSSSLHLPLDVEEHDVLMAGSWETLNKVFNLLLSAYLELLGSVDKQTKHLCDVDAVIQYLSRPPH